MPAATGDVSIDEFHAEFRNLRATISILSGEVDSVMRAAEMMKQDALLLLKERDDLREKVRTGNVINFGPNEWGGHGDKADTPGVSIIVNGKPFTLYDVEGRDLTWDGKPKVAIVLRSESPSLD